jgi:hypothetical protein
MPGGFERYAIFWLPEPGSALAKFGAAWFGEDGERNLFGLPADLTARALAAAPRYRLHATLKAPFRLRAGVESAELEAELSRFCSKRKAARAGRLRLTKFPRYLALAPEGQTAEVDWLAEECVTHFDRFRAPLNAEDRARRPDISGPAQAALFEAFGYPYVLSRFAFHVTLAGPLDRPDLDAVAEALAPALAETAAEPLTVESIALLGDPGGESRFEIVGNCPLMGRTPRAIS